MELLTFTVPKSADTLTIAPIGDIQWSGKNGPTAKDQLKRHIDFCLERDAYFVGLGDYIDMLSPSNRKRIAAAGLYDTAMEVLWEKSKELTLEVYEQFLKPTTGRWLGLVHGHHFYAHDGESSDEYLCSLLKAPFIGTSGFLRNHAHDFTVYVSHGSGGGVLPGSALNRPYHIANGLQGADVYLFGHSTKLAATTLSRPFPVWGKRKADHRLEHRDIFLLSCGGFSKSNIVGKTWGDYAEQAGMTPSPLKAPIITVDLTCTDRAHRTRVLV